LSGREYAPPVTPRIDAASLKHVGDTVWLLLIGFLITLWLIALSIWLLWKWVPPGGEVRRPMHGPADKR
jgi:uncharacterized BrkB/YihY/UPF0761 family membrane protein